MIQSRIAGAALTTISLKFDGMDADSHSLDVRSLGECLVAFDRMTNYGMLSLCEYRFPRRGERFPLRVIAQEPRQGSFDIIADLAPYTSILLPLVPEMFYTGASEILWNWASWVVKRCSGNDKQAEPHFTALMDLTKELHRSQALSEERTHRFLLEALEKMRPIARDLVAPVGPSANTLSIANPAKEDSRTVIDLPMADSIRAGERFEVGEMETMTLTVDGLIHHSKQLKVQHPELTGKFVSASVQDPAFNEVDNPYTRAVARRGRLQVAAKPVRKLDGTLHTLYIMDAKNLD